MIVLHRACVLRRVGVTKGVVVGRILINMSAFGVPGIRGMPCLRDVEAGAGLPPPPHCVPPRPNARGLPLTYTTHLFGDCGPEPYITIPNRIDN